MTGAITIDAALADENLLGAALGPVAPWSTWLAVLRAAFGEKLDTSKNLQNTHRDRRGLRRVGTEGRTVAGGQPSI